MKKNVIALAVAAAMAAPLAAQAEVKVSGKLQAEVVNLSADDEFKAIGVNEGLYMTDAQEGGNMGSGNFGALAFSASEDLGGGMKALAKYGMNVSVDGRGIAQRDAYVGLSGGFGTVLLGTMNNPYKSATVSWDPFLATSGQARGNFGMSTLHNGYAGNVIAYANKFGAAKVVVGVSIDEAEDPDNAGETRGDHGTHASVNVPVGPVELALGYHDGGVEDSGAMKVGAKYAAGPMSVAFQYEDLEAGVQNNLFVDPNGANGLTDLGNLLADLDGDGNVTAAEAAAVAGAMGSDGETFMLVNATYTAGANTFAISYGMNEAEYTGGTLDNEHMTVGMVHALSKTTTAHVAYTNLSVDGEVDASGIAAGLRVKF